MYRLTYRVPRLAIDLACGLCVGMVWWSRGRVLLVGLVGHVENLLRVAQEVDREHDHQDDEQTQQHRYCDLAHIRKVRRLVISTPEPIV
jgi:hypothetical protein